MNKDMIVPADELAEITEGLVFDPDITAGEVREYHARAFMDMMEVGRRLLLAKESLEYGEFITWLSESCDFSDRTARTYMKMAARGYQYRDQIKSMKANAFKTMLKLPLDLFEQVMTTGQFNGKDIDGMTAGEIENEFVKLDTGNKLLQMKLDEATRELKEGESQLDTAEKEKYKLEKEIEKLKNPKLKNEEQLRQAQELINEAVINLEKAMNIKIPEEMAHTLLSPLSISFKNIQEAWKWEGLPPTSGTLSIAK